MEKTPQSFWLYKQKFSLLFGKLDWQGEFSLKVDYIVISVAMFFFISWAILTGTVMEVSDISLRAQLLTLMNILFGAAIALVILIELVVFSKRMLSKNM